MHFIFYNYQITIIINLQYINILLNFQFLEIFSFISVETNLIGSDFAVLHITVQWSEPCGSPLDITVVYNIKNTTLNSTIKYQYNLISDKNGSIVVLRELEVNSLYEYQVFIYNTTLVIKSVNGVFKTLKNITIPG